MMVFQLFEILPLILMGVLGFPHGAFDALILNKKARSKWEFSKYILMYFSIFLLSLLVWFVEKEVAFILFVTMTIWHFGSCDSNRKNYFFLPIQIFSWGGITMIALPTWQEESVRTLLNILNIEPYWFFYILEYIFPLWVICTFSLFLALLLEFNRSKFIELFLLITVTYTLPPLWSLCIYFSFFHARKHTNWISKIFPDLFSKKEILIFTLISTLLIFIVIYIFSISNSSVNSSLSNIFVEVFFAFLFSITVPHMILIDFFLRRESTSLNS